MSLGQADVLSRCLLPATVEDPAPVALELASSPITAIKIARHTAKDKTLAQVLSWVGRRWPKGPVRTDLQPFHTRQHELSAQKNCLLWGDRVMVCPKLRRPILEVHVCHPGIIRMKALARSYIGWPNMDRDIKQWVDTCTKCQEHKLKTMTR